MQKANKKYIPKVMFPEIKLASFWVSAMAAIGIPQLTTGPQKCYLKMLASYIYKHVKKLNSIHTVL